MEPRVAFAEGDGLFRGVEFSRGVRLPSSIDDSVEKYDSGFLESVFGAVVNNDFKWGSVQSGYDFLSSLEDFADVHLRSMMYSTWKDLWRVCNYAYENLRFLAQGRKLRGDCYHLTGHDGTKRNGDVSELFTLNSEVETFALPLLFRNHPKGIIIAQEYECNRGSYGVVFLVGDKCCSSYEIKMPNFQR